MTCECPSFIHCGFAVILFMLQINMQHYNLGCCGTGIEVFSYCYFVFRHLLITEHLTEVFQRGWMWNRKLLLHFWNLSCKPLWMSRKCLSYITLRKCQQKCTASDWLKRRWRQSRCRLEETTRFESFWRWELMPTRCAVNTEWSSSNLKVGRSIPSLPKKSVLEQDAEPWIVPLRTTKCC